MSGGNWKDMFYACQRGDVELVKYYIKEGININYQHPEFLTSPLLECIRLNQLDVAKFLLENGADPYQKEGFGTENSFDLAKMKRSKEAIELLKNYKK